MPRLCYGSAEQVNLLCSHLNRKVQFSVFTFHFINSREALLTFQFSLFSFHFSLYMRCYNKKLLKNFVYNPSSSSNLIYNEKDVTDVADDITAEGLIKLDIGHC